MKLVNNLVLGLNRVALAEGLVFAKAIGLDPAKTLDVLKEGNSYSGVMDTKGRKMIEGDFSLQAKLSQHAKDVRIILEEAARGGVSLPAFRAPPAAAGGGGSGRLRRGGQQCDHPGDRRPCGREQGAIDRSPSVVALSAASWILESEPDIYCLTHDRHVQIQSRRTFLKTAVAGAAALGLPAAVRALAAPTKKCASG